MADPKLVELLKKGPQVWNDWRREEERGSDTPMFPDFQYAYLVRANLREANLVGAMLGQADLSGADLRRARLDNADLWLAVLSKANLAGACLIEANLQLPTPAGRPGTPAKTSRSADQRPKAAR